MSVRDLISSVPQGSVIGPLLFLLYVNGLPDVAINSKVALFADDLALPEGVQRRATKFILCDYELPYRLRLIKLNLLPISYWLELKDLFFFCKCKQGNFDVDISQYLTFSFQRSSHTHSSQANMLFPNFCRTCLFRASFFNRIVFLWNGLPSSIRDISSVSSFKHNLFSHCF